MPQSDALLFATADRRRWWLVGGRILPRIAGADEPPAGDPPPNPPAGDPPPEPPTLEAQATAAVEKLAKGEKLSEAELGALRKVSSELGEKRKGEGKYRTESKAEREKREAAEKERDELKTKLLEFLDPAKAKEAADADAKRKDQETRDAEKAEAERLKAENRALRLRGLFDRRAADKHVDPDLAWGYLSAGFGEVDPADEAKAAEAIDKAIDKAATDKPSLKVQRYAGVGGADMGGGRGGNGGRPGSLAEAVRGHYQH
jgi:hypothetical protein